MTERITIWVSKYALSQGIQKFDDCEIWNPADGMVCHNHYQPLTTYYHRGDWHHTEAEAIARAEEMRVAKIKSLEKRIAKLRAMTFGEKEDD